MSVSHAVVPALKSQLWLWALAFCQVRFLEEARVASSLQIPGTHMRHTQWALSSVLQPGLPPQSQVFKEKKNPRMDAPSLSDHLYVSQHLSPPLKEISHFKCSVFVNKFSLSYFGYRLLFDKKSRCQRQIYIGEIQMVLIFLV